MKKVTNLDSSIVTRNTALGLYGEYLAETRSENLQYIVDNYLKRSIAIVHELSQNSEKIRKSNQSQEYWHQYDLDNRKRNYLISAKCKSYFVFLR